MINQEAILQAGKDEFEKHYATHCAELPLDARVDFVSAILMKAVDEALTPNTPKVDIITSAIIADSAVMKLRELINNPNVSRDAATSAALVMFGADIALRKIMSNKQPNPANN